MTARRPGTRAMGFALAVALLCAQPGPAADRGGQVSLTAREQPIGAFLRDLGGQMGVLIIASSSLQGFVNGQFSGPASKVLRDVCRAFDVVIYDDGGSLYAYSSAELGSRTLAFAARDAAALAAQVRSLGLVDANNRLRAADNGTLMITGTPRFLTQVADMARAFPRRDARTTPANASGSGFEVRIFPLRFARAEDTVTVSNGRETRLPGVATLLRAMLADEEPVPAAPRAPTRVVRQSADRLGGRGLASVDPDYAQTPLLGLTGDEVMPAFAAGGRLPTLRDAAVPEAPPAPGNRGGIRIQPSPAANAVIVRDRPENMAANEQLIRAIDVKPQLVEVEATIIDINTEKLRRLGVNFRFGSGGLGILFGNGMASDQRLVPTPTDRRTNTEAVTPSAAGLAVSTVIGGSRELIARISALEANGVARIVSRPQVVTLSNVEAVFDRTRSFYVRVAGRANVDLFNVTAGTALRVTPQVFQEDGVGQVRLIIAIEDGSLSEDVVDGLPVVDRSTVTTQALLANGQSLLLGGLTVDRSSNAVNQVPGLGDIPLVGNLFRDRRRSESRTERLFLITPRVVGPDDLPDARSAALAAAEPGGAMAGSSIAGTAGMRR